MTDEMKNLEAERAIIGAVLHRPKLLEGTTPTGLEAKDFSDAAHRAIWDAMEQGYYSDRPVDPISVARRASKHLSDLWDGSEEAHSKRLQGMVRDDIPYKAAFSHAHIIKRESNRRNLLSLVRTCEARLVANEVEPEELVGELASASVEGAIPMELISLREVGSTFLGELRETQKLHESGEPVGVFTGISAIDKPTGGILPTELAFLAGDAGVGKSAVAFVAAINFARAQKQRPPDRQVGTLILSLEMGNRPSAARMSQILGDVPSEKLRTGDLSEAEYRSLVASWQKETQTPIWFNYANFPRSSQLRAIVAEAVRRHNVGFVVLDHFRHFRTDEPMRPNEADETKVLFLKQMALELDIALYCLAHTRKPQNELGRPSLADLRGSGMIAAVADQVSFLYRPAKHDEDEDPLKAEMIWEKNRHGADDTVEFQLDLARMRIR